jgi:SAM-dependent methyltransferase
MSLGQFLVLTIDTLDNSAAIIRGCHQGWVPPDRSTRNPFQHMRAAQAFRTLLEEYPFTSVLDVGAGRCEHALEFARQGKRVTAVDHQMRQRTGDAIDFIQADFTDPDCVVWARKFDCVWCSHTLEHQRNVGWLLDCMVQCLPDDGILAITVPPLKHRIVGGHLSLWNMGLLCYNLIMAGLDLRGATTLQEGYDISVIVRKKMFDRRKLRLFYDNGDISALSPYFPVGDLKEGFDGRTLTNGRANK